MKIGPQCVHFNPDDLATIGSGLFLRREVDTDADWALTLLQQKKLEAEDNNPGADFVVEVGLNTPMLSVCSRGIEAFLWQLYENDVQNTNPQLAAAAARLFADCVEIYANNARHCSDY